MARTDKYPGQTYTKTGLVKGGQGIYETSSTARHTVGERMCLGDGRVFYYAKKDGTATTRRGILLVADVDAAEVDTSVTEAIGDKTVASFTTVGAMGPAYIGGLCGVTTGTGGGQSYVIADVTQGTTSGTSDIHLYDEIKATLTAATVTLTQNPFYGVQTANDEANMFLGVALITVPANHYFWLQTYGWVAGVRGDSLGDLANEREILPHASGVTMLETANGCLGKWKVGHNVYYSADNVSGEAHVAFLTIWP